MGELLNTSWCCSHLGLLRVVTVLEKQMKPTCVGIVNIAVSSSRASAEETKSKTQQKLRKAKVMWPFDVCQVVFGVPSAQMFDDCTAFPTLAGQNNAPQHVKLALLSELRLASLVPFSMLYLVSFLMLAVRYQAMVGTGLT